MWNVSCGLPRGVKLLFLFSPPPHLKLCLHVFFTSLNAPNVNITVWGHHKKLFFIYISFVILSYCAYAYSILWSLTFIGNLFSLFDM